MINNVLSIIVLVEALVVLIIAIRVYLSLKSFVDLVNAINNRMKEWNDKIGGVKWQRMK